MCVFFACLFLAASTSMSIQKVFYSVDILTFLSISAFYSSILTILFALSVIPKWQSYFGVVVFIYAVIWQMTESIGIH